MQINGQRPGTFQNLGGFLVVRAAAKLVYRKPNGPLIVALIECTTWRVAAGCQKTDQ